MSVPMILTIYGVIYGLLSFIAGYSFGRVMEKNKQPNVYFEPVKNNICKGCGLVRPIVYEGYCNFCSRQPDKG